jgi:uncharacterized membrane protein YvlD (DUF360 family)
MVRALRFLVSWLVRHAVLWIVDALALALTALLVPGIYFSGTDTASPFLLVVAAAFLLGLVNLLIRPIVLLAARPLGFFALFAIGLVVNSLTLWITSWLLPGFSVEGWLSALIGGFAFVAVNTLMTTILELNDEGSFYENRIERLAARQPFEGASEPGVGLVMMEIDGLSYHHMKKALDDGLMPTLAELMEEEGYELSQVDCGIPSQTSACQAGIMFGDNHDIPAFRWYDKDEQKLYVSGSDAPAINARYAQGNGLMRGGASIDNMLNGDAEKSLLTLADLRDADREQMRRRTADIYLLSLNPYFLARTFVLTLGAVVRELWEGWRQRRKDVQPRLNRLAHFYPFVRAATSVFVRDLSAQLTVMDVMRGAPAIYVTWPGYDEVAHHSGPWTTDAFSELARYDKVIARVLRIIRDKAPRPYELVVLSDHGQSFGATFLQRYGVSLKEFIEQYLPEGTGVSQSMGGDTGVTTLTAAQGELQNVQDMRTGQGFARSAAKRLSGLIGRGVKAQESSNGDSAAAQVIACGSGNLAQVYFDLHPRRITLDELESAYPGMVGALVEHEGVGFVAGYDGDGTPVVLGKGGRRDLHSGEVEGVDPLAAFAPDEGWGAASLEKRIWQVRRVMDFPHAGDLMVVSAVYEDGTVAALEELIGSHGGMGGEQTDAFLFHPPTIEVPDTRNSIDVFHILNGRRGGPVAEKPPEPVPPDAIAWSPGNLLRGIANVGAWLPNALRCLILDPSAYKRVVNDLRMTGPALLIGVVGQVFSEVAREDALQWWRIPTSLLTWWISTLAVYAAGRILSRKGTYTRTFRAMGFAQVVYLIDVFAFIPGFGSAVRFLAGALGFVAVWMGAATAHEIRGFRTILLGILPTVVALLSLAVVVVLLLGAGVSLESMLENLGLAGGQ